MARIQTFVSNQVKEEIHAIVTERKQEGATDSDSTVSSVTSMLIELGLRVYRMQCERKESGFNQMEYNRHMLDNMARVRAMCSEILKMGVISEEVIASGDFKFDVIRPQIERFSNEQVAIFFPDDGDASQT